MFSHAVRTGMPLQHRGGRHCNGRGLTPQSVHSGQWLSFKAFPVDKMALVNPSLHLCLLFLPKGRFFRETVTGGLPFMRG